jgi:hypothetical protein
MTMELDEMKLAWQVLDRRFGKQHALNVQLFGDGRMDKLRRGLRPLVWGQIFQLAIGVVLAGAAAAFWAPRVHVTDVLVCGLLVHAYGLMLIVFAVRVLYLIQRIDHAAPVLSLQRQLADLRTFRVRVEAPTHAVLGCFVWIPVTWMLLAWHGVDPWSHDFVLWAIASSLVGLSGVALVLWWMRRMGLQRKIDDHAAGRSVQKAEAVLEAIARFEHD